MPGDSLKHLDRPILRSSLARNSPAEHRIQPTNLYSYLAAFSSATTLAFLTTQSVLSSAAGSRPESPFLTDSNGQIAHFRSRLRGMVTSSFLPLRKEFRLVLPGLSVRNCRDRIKPTVCADEWRNCQILNSLRLLSGRPQAPFSHLHLRSAQRNDRSQALSQRYPRQNPCGKGRRIRTPGGSANCG
jgi:hypothetical protein